MSVPRPGRTPAVEAGATFSRHAVIYGIGSFIGLSLALANAILLTRVLEPRDFGIFGLAMVSASFVTIALNVPLLHGALARSFGNTGDEEADDEDALPAGRDPRRSFGSALAATGGAGALLALVAVLAAGIGFGPGRTAAIVLLVAVSGGAGALWRLMSSVLRLQRRPVAFVALFSVRPILVIAASLGLVLSGGGVVGAIAGVALGSVVACVIAAFVVRATYTRAFEPGELRIMSRTSRRYFPVIAGFWIILNADLYIVAAFSDVRAAGEYRLASRLGGLATYATSAMLTAWAPLERGSVFKAADEVHGRDAVRGRMLFVFLLLCAGMALTLGVAADALVRLAPADYRGAAELLPWLALAFAAHGAVVGIYRATQFAQRAPLYRKGALRAGIAFAPLAIGLVAAFGAPGAPIAATIVLAVFGGVLVHRASRAGRPLVLPWRRVGAGVAVAAGLYALTLLVPDDRAGIATAADVAAPLVFAAIAVAILPATHRALLWRVLRATVR